MTDRQKYNEVQDRLRKKIVKGRCSNKEEGFNKGILCAMSIIKDIYGLPDRSDKRGVGDE